MTEIDKQTSSLFQDHENWFSRLWAQFHKKMNPPANPEALREAVVELIEAQPLTASGVPTAEQMLLTNILKLRTRQVGDCMIPRADIRAVDINTTPQELVALMAHCKHSRIPIYRETLDDVLGMIHMKDILLCLAEGRTCVIRDLIRPVLIVVPSMAASKLLLQMRQTRQHMAMVVDEFGGVDGIVTIEDLVEEIVGEIDDEHDAPASPDIIARADGTLLIDARLSIEVLEDKVGRSLLAPDEREEIDTVGGYVLSLAGHVPKIGETFKCFEGYEFEVLEADQSRILRLRMRTLHPQTDES